jgi:hypothetical protein
VGRAVAGKLTTGALAAWRDERLLDLLYALRIRARSIPTHWQRADRRKHL